MLAATQKAVQKVSRIQKRHHSEPNGIAKSKIETANREVSVDAAFRPVTLDCKNSEQRIFAPGLDNVLINGGFFRGLWNRLPNSIESLECPVWRQTFAADRWKIRYAQAQGAPVSQAMSWNVPGQIADDYSLEIRGAEGVTQNVFLGQRIEAAEAARYQRRMVFSAWILIANGETKECKIQLVIGSAREMDSFGDALNNNVKHEWIAQIGRVPANRWVRLETEFDARGFGANGLSIELEFPAEFLQKTNRSIHVANVRLADAAHGANETTRPSALESILAKRFFQKHDSGSMNSVGRALVVNAHELHFQFAFPEMRAFPACTLPQENEQLRVFDLEGIPHDGFAYDVTYRSRGSVIVRATKPHHCLRDGFLSFVGNGGAILLDAEL